MLHFDTESVGLTGPCVLIQYAYDDGPVTLHEVFYEPVRKTLKLIEEICDNDICAFNLTHDWFHLTKLYNLLHSSHDVYKPPRMDAIVEACRKGYNEFCLRPRSALDLFLHARKGPWQSLMDRRDIRIKRVPIALGTPLSKVLHEHLKFEWIYFARGTEGYKWKVEPCEDDPTFVDIVLRFKASGALKNLCSETFRESYQDFPIPKGLYPEENAYNPYDTRWTSVIEDHIKWWHFSKKARSYAETDVILLQKLYHHFGEPPCGDIDSELACAVGAARWRGFAINSEGVDIRIINKEFTAGLPAIKYGLNINSHVQVRAFLKNVATPEESICINDTSAETMKLLSAFDSKLGRYAKEIYDARRAAKELDILRKLKETGRFCPQYKVIGTKSGRMSGGSELQSGITSLNPQGINRSKEYRSLFTFVDDNTRLSGGDFEGFEVVIADAAYNDRMLRQDLQSGKSFHGLFGTAIYSLPYEQIMASKGGEIDYYSSSKAGGFGIIYGQRPAGLAKRLGLTETQAESAYQTLIKRYPGIGTSRKAIFDAFCSMRQPGGVGTEVQWHDSPRFIESLLGYRRYFDLENKIIYCLFKLAQQPPKCLDAVGKIVRRDRQQTPRGAMQSALYACAFNMQAYNMRAAANHVIQSTGGEICKTLQCAIWQTIQPVGIHEWRVCLMNQHDEVLCVHPPEETERIKFVVKEVVEGFRKVIPLLSLPWKTNLNNWGDLK